MCWLSLFSALDKLIKNWAPLKSYFLSRGEDGCERIMRQFIGNQVRQFIGDQADRLPDTVMLPECYFHFVHSILAVHSAILTLEKSNLEPTELYVVTNLKRQLKNRTQDMFFEIKTSQNRPAVHHSKRNVVGHPSSLQTKRNQLG